MGSRLSVTIGKNSKTNKMNATKFGLFVCLACLIGIFITVAASAQTFVNIGAGVARVTQEAKVQENVSASVKLSGGYRFNNGICTEGIIQYTVSSYTNTPNYFGVKGGYYFKGFIPMVGYLYNYRNSDDISVNRWEAGYSLKYQFDMNENGGIYIDALYTRSSWQLTAGVNIIF